VKENKENGEEKHWGKERRKLTLVASCGQHGTFDDTH
jgi:hypothetical protein